MPPGSDSQKPQAMEMFAAKSPQVGLSESKGNLLGSYVKKLAAPPST